MPYLGKSPSAGVRQRYQYTATASQTTFSGTDTANLTLNYTDNNFVDVYQNGVLLKDGTTDYTDTSGTSVVLTTGASVSDVIEIIVYDVFSVGNFYNRTDSDSRFVRHDSGTLGTDNFIAGNNAGDAITSGGNENTLVGNEAGTALTTGDANVAVGFEALATEDANGQNVAVGYRALKTLNAGADAQNTAVGYNAGTSITTGVENVLVGATAGDAITDADFNVGIGWGALGANVLGSKSVAVGTGALDAQNPASATDMHNTAVGHGAGTAVTTGTENVFVGDRSGDAVTTGQRNVAIGSQALTTNTVADNCVAIGQGALYAHNVGSNADTNNTAVGYQAGVTVSTGTNNTLIGTSAGNLIAGGEQNTCLGASAGDTATSANRCTIIGYNADVSASGAFDQNVLGNGVTCSGNNQTTIGASTDDTAFTNGGTSLSAPSDQRYKQDITSSTAGLGFINDLRPVTFKWKMKKDLPSDHRAYEEGSTTRVMKAKDELYHGFIAQEVKTALDNHSEVKNYDEFWMENDDGRQRLAPAFLIPMLTKAVQELSAKNDALEARIKKLEDG